MPAKSEKQANFFRLVRGVQTGSIPASKVSSNIRKVANSISAKDAQDFTKLKEIAKQVLQNINEEKDDPVVKQIKATENFEKFLNKSQNRGEVFTTEEIDAFENFEEQPTTKTTNQVKFSSVDELSGKNKELVIIKKQKRYVGMFCVNDPTNLSGEEKPDKETPEDETPEENKPEEEKDDIYIKVSRPFDDKENQSDIGLLSNFVNILLKELLID